MARRTEIAPFVAVAALMLVCSASAGSSWPRPGTAERASVPYHGGQSNLFAFEPSMSFDGKVVAWDSYATDFVPDDTNGIDDVFARDLRSGRTVRVSVASDGTQGNQGSIGTALTLALQGKGKQRRLVGRPYDRDTPFEGIPERTIDFFADGKAIGSAPTGEDGVAVLDLPRKYQAGKHVFAARFGGDDYYLASATP